jgi:hypothetical protein
MHSRNRYRVITIVADFTLVTKNAKKYCTSFLKQFLDNRKFLQDLVSLHNTVFREVNYYSMKYRLLCLIHGLSNSGNVEINGISETNLKAKFCTKSHVVRLLFVFVVLI